MIRSAVVRLIAVSLLATVTLAPLACTPPPQTLTEDPVRSVQLAGVVSAAGAGASWFPLIDMVQGSPKVSVVGAGTELTPSPFPNGWAYVYLAAGAEANTPLAAAACAAIRSAMRNARPPILVTKLQIVGASTLAEC